MKQIRLAVMAIAALSPCFLVVCLYVYIASGIDLLPGDNSGRWFALIVTSIISIPVFGICYTLEHSDE